MGACARESVRLTYACSLMCRIGSLALFFFPPPPLLFSFSVPGSLPPGETVSLVDVDISRRGVNSLQPPTPPPPPRRSLSLLGTFLSFLLTFPWCFFCHVTLFSKCSPAAGLPPFTFFFWVPFSFSTKTLMQIQKYIEDLCKGQTFKKKYIYISWRVRKGGWELSMVSFSNLNSCSCCLNVF